MQAYDAQLHGCKNFCDSTENDNGVGTYFWGV